MQIVFIGHQQNIDMQRSFNSFCNGKDYTDMETFFGSCTLPESKKCKIFQRLVYCSCPQLGNTAQTALELFHGEFFRHIIKALSQTFICTTKTAHTRTIPFQGLNQAFSLLLSLPGTIKRFVLKNSNLIAHSAFTANK